MNGRKIPIFQAFRKNATMKYGQGYPTEVRVRTAVSHMIPQADDVEDLSLHSDDIGGALAVWSRDLYVTEAYTQLLDSGRCHSGTSGF